MCLFGFFTVCLLSYVEPKLKMGLFTLGTIHLRHRQIFTIFDPYPPPVGNFLLLSIGKFDQFLTPPPLEHADVLDGWSLRTKAHFENFTTCPFSLYFLKCKRHAPIFHINISKRQRSDSIYYLSSNVFQA